MALTDFHPIIKYILSTLPPLQRRMYGGDPIEIREPDDAGFEYYYEFHNEPNNTINLKDEECRTHPIDALTSGSFIADNHDHTNSNHINNSEFAEKDYLYESKSKTFFGSKGYPIGLGLFLKSVSFQMQYYTIDNNISCNEYFGYDVNARNFPLLIEVAFSFSAPEPYGGDSLCSKYGRHETAPIGSNAYALILQTLARDFAEFRLKYDRQCQMTIDFLTDVGKSFEPSEDIDQTARLFQCDKALIQYLIKDSARGLIKWTSGVLQDGRQYCKASIQKPDRTQREISIRPVGVANDQYRTQTPFMWQLKSDELSRFFLASSAFGKKLNTIIVQTLDSGMINTTRRTYCNQDNKSQHFFFPSNSRPFKTVAIQSFDESLLLTNATLFINTLSKMTLMRIITWKQVESSDYMCDEENLHDFWITHFRIHKRTFKIQLRRLFLTDVYGWIKCHFFTELIVNGHARIFDLASSEGVACEKLREIQSYIAKYGVFKRDQM